MAREERTTALLAGAGFNSIRLEHVPVRFAFGNLDDYEQWVIDVAGTLAMVVRGLPEDERHVLRARIHETFIALAAEEGFVLPGLALCAVAR
jgi:hypothetical protein